MICWIKFRCSFRIDIDAIIFPTMYGNIHRYVEGSRFHMPHREVVNFKSYFPYPWSLCKTIRTTGSTRPSAIYANLKFLCLHKIPAAILICQKGSENPGSLVDPLASARSSEWIPSHKRKRHPWGRWFTVTLGLCRKCLHSAMLFWYLPTVYNVEDSKYNERYFAS